MDFEHPYILLLISPVFLIGWLAIRRGVSKPLIISRMIIFSLLIIALASPFTIGMTIIHDEVPRITILSDQTMSMDLFDTSHGKELYDYLKSKTPTNFRKFSGISSPIGDEIISVASGDNNVVVLTDGNNNFGKDLSDAISFVSNTGTRVFAVKEPVLYNDASVEIQTAKNLIIGNKNVFNILIRQAGEKTEYRLDVSIDGVSVLSKDIVQTKRIKKVSVPYIFNTLGTHTVTAEITPKNEDRFKINNIFYSSVFVVPKPKILFITNDMNSPLYQVITSLYDATISDFLIDDLTEYKAVIIDNQPADDLNTDVLKKYVADGGGLVVIGGDAAYNKGSYNNSEFEKILPIISRSGEFKGGKSIVLLIDSSSSTGMGDANTGNTFISLIDANAIGIVDKISGDTNIGVVAFGGEKTESTELLSMSNTGNRIKLEDFIRNIGPKSGDLTTDLDVGLLKAEQLLMSGKGDKEIIVLSDGVMPNKGEGFEAIKNEVEKLTNKNIKIHFVQVLISFQNNKNPFSLYEELANTAGENVLVLNPDERATTLIGAKVSETPQTEATPEQIYEFPILAINKNHFITKFLNLTASVTGYNDVIPKIGSDELVATTRGKPILTVWNFGLGRVAAFTTDNGDADTNWANMVYSGENSRLISTMINWAIADPRPNKGMVIKANDMWAGTKSRILVTSDSLPNLNLDGKTIDFSRTERKNTYEAFISLEEQGFHDLNFCNLSSISISLQKCKLSGYGIAVNYPIEYREVGFNENFKKAINSNGGKVYNWEDVKSLLLLDIKEKSTRTVKEKKSNKELFLLAALLLFLTEVIVRRLKDYKRKT